jgi:hypothetical protein
MRQRLKDLWFFLEDSRELPETAFVLVLSFICLGWGIYSVSRVLLRGLNDRST